MDSKLCAQCGAPFLRYRGESVKYWAKRRFCSNICRGNARATGFAGRDLSQARLREVFDYSPDTGLFVWRQAPSSRVKIGTIAGRVSHGYRHIALDGKRYAAHRLAWFYVHGVWPKDDMDHINGEKDDNRLANLREATTSQNMANARLSSHNTSGFKGVSWKCGTNKWNAKISHNGVTYHIGYFTTREAAHEAYVIKARELFGEFARAA